MDQRRKSSFARHRRDRVCLMAWRLCPYPSLPAQLPGDLGFDPLGLKPTNDKDLKSMATKELNNGRLAMIGIAGMVAQELVSGMKI